MTTSSYQSTTSISPQASRAMPASNFEAMTITFFASSRVTSAAR
jgi:hypothetical protein